MKNSSIFFFFGLCLFTFASAMAAPFDVVDDLAEVEGDEESRLLNLNNGNLILNLNSTSLVTIAIVAGILIVIAAAIATVFSFPSTAGAASEYSNNYQSYSNQYRRKRFAEDEDLASKMYRLAEAFKKYEIQEECHMFMTCTSRIFSDKSPISSIINDNLKSFIKAEREEARSKNPHFGRLLDAYVDGETGDCEKHRGRCYRKKFY